MKTPIDIQTKVQFSIFSMDYFFCEDSISCKNTNEAIYYRCVRMVAMCQEVLEKVHKTIFPNLNLDVNHYSNLKISSEPFEDSIPLYLQSGAVKLKKSGKSYGLGMAQSAILDYFIGKGYHTAYISLTPVEAGV